MLYLVCFVYLSSGAAGNYLSEKEKDPEYRDMTRLVLVIFFGLSSYVLWGY